MEKHLRQEEDLTANKKEIRAAIHSLEKMKRSRKLVFNMLTYFTRGRNVMGALTPPAECSSSLCIAGDAIIRHRGLEAAKELLDFHAPHVIKNAARQIFGITHDNLFHHTSWSYKNAKAYEIAKTTSARIDAGIAELKRYL